MNTNTQHHLHSIETTAIERIDRPTPEEFKKNFFSCKKPVIITGKMENWKALSLWTPDYLNNAAGVDTEVNVSFSQNKIFNGDPEKGVAPWRRKMKFGDFMNLVLQHDELAEESYYLQQYPITTFPKLIEDIENPEYFDPKLLVFRNFWVGSGGNISPLHYDISQNFHAQVKGRKRVLLFAPQQTDLLYPFPAHSKIPHISQIDIDRPDLQKFPKFQKTRCFECTIEPGEMLFIPVFWWHQVYCLDKLNLSVNFWWKADLTEFFAVYAVEVISR